MSQPSAPTYTLVARIPTPEEHRALFEAVGWHPYSEAETAIALQNTLLGVVAEQDGPGGQRHIIGMGRVIGDGGKFYYIQDFAVRPEIQRAGVGRAMLRHLMDAIRAHAPGEPFVGLFATDVADAFYREFGFEPREHVLRGMWQVLMPESDDQAPADAESAPDAASDAESAPAPSTPGASHTNP